MRLALLLPLLVCCTTHPATTDAGPEPDDAEAGTPPLSRIPVNHRPAAMPCSHSRPTDLIPDGGYPDAANCLGGCDGACISDSDCDAGVNGRCVVGVVSNAAQCTYDDCFSDSDCESSEVCDCRDIALNGANACVPADCHVDTDCGDGGYCSPSPGGCIGNVGPVGYYCHTPRDECVNDSDCNATFPNLFCIFDPTAGARWICAPIDCTG